MTTLVSVDGTVSLVFFFLAALQTSFLLVVDTVHNDEWIFQQENASTHIILFKNNFFKF